jgi:hypothetical protein
MIKKLFDKFRQTQVGKSIFRRNYEDTTKERMLAIRGNVFMHLHPIRLKRGAVKLRYISAFPGPYYLWCVVDVLLSPQHA